MPKNAKSANATVEELNNAKEELQTALEALNRKATELQNTLTSAKNNLTSKINEVQGNLDKECKNRAEAFEKAKDEIAATENRSHSKEEQIAFRKFVEDGLKGLREGVESKAGEWDQEVRRDCATKLETASNSFAQDLLKLQGGLEDLVARRVAEAAEARRVLREEVDATIDKAMFQAASGSAETGAKAASDLAAHKELQQQEDKARDQRAKGERAEVEKEIADIAAEVKQQGISLAQSQNESRSVLDQRLSDVAAQAEKRLAELDAQVMQAMTDVRATISDVENMPTKTVDWVIREASKMVKVPEPSPMDLEPHTSWYSPVFDASGARGLQLELRAFGYPDKNASGADKDRGNCALYLRAAKGTHIAFRLAMGPHSQSFERKFHGPKDIVGTSRMCFLEDHINSKTDSLKITVEVLETIAESEQKGFQNQDEARVPVSTSMLLLSRHVNNRVLSQVKAQVNHFRALNTRRVEWRLEEASSMKVAFPKGAPMMSKEFDAASLAGLKLAFYPSGHDSATEGFCSLYLSAPQGATIRCQMQAGPERRDMVHTYEQPGHCGRANFCRFESCVNLEDDTILIVLEIEDAHQDLVARFGQLPPANAGIRSLLDEVEAREVVGGPNASVERNSELKLQMHSKSLPSELRETKVLPSLCAERNKHDLRVDASRSLQPSFKDSRRGLLRSHSQADPGWRRRQAAH